MNREIKFRAWNKVWGMMSLVDKIEFEEGKPVSVSVTIKATDFDHTDEWSDYEVGDDIILQQFTGLKDKNGKEIYDGDIVRFENKAYEIRFFNKWGMFGLVGKSDYKDFTEEDPLGSGGSSTRYKPYVLGEYYQKRIEVIGNVFENPELLNEII